jgi:cyclic-di-GMP-binding protein
MPSFDIVSKVPWHEVENAVQQAQKEIGTRFDFRGTGAEIDHQKEVVLLKASAEDRVKAVLDVLKEKLVKRKVSLKHLDVGKVEQTGKGGSKIQVKIKEGIDSDHAKSLIKLIKDEKLKVQSSIHEDQVRVSGKKRDDLQAAIHAIKEMARTNDLDIELQFVNFRE